MRRVSFEYQPCFCVIALFVTSLLMLVGCELTAQIRQTHRYEKEQKDRDEYFTVIPMDNGLALLREQDKYQSNKRLWQIFLLDTALNEKASMEFHIEERYPLIGYEVTPERLYLLYRTGDTNKNSFELLEFNTLEGKEMGRYEIKPEVQFKITHFSKVGSSVAFGGYVTSDPAILLYDLASKGLKIVPGFFQKDNELVDLRVNQNMTFNVILIDRSLKSERKLVFRTFDETGKLLLEDIVPIAEEKALQTSISSRLKREDLIVAGTWGDRLGKQSTGFFTIPIDPFSEQKINYYQFGELRHFTDYLNPKRADRIKANARDDLKAGRNPSFSAYVMPFVIEENQHGYFLLAEVYNPITTANPYYSNSYNNPYYPNPYYFNSPFWPSYYPGMRYRSYAYGNNVKNADEIKTYATVILAFDANGKLVWDESIKLEDVEKGGLEQVSDFYVTGEKVYFLYKYESEIRGKIVDLDSDSSADVTQKIKMGDPADEIRDEVEQEGGVKHWNENSFYVWGYQTIRNQLRKDDRVRDVFYISKVEVE